MAKKRVLPIASVLALAFWVTVPLWSVGAASKPIRLATLDDLAVVWVGGSPETGTHFVRLELSKAGVGVLTIQEYPGARVQAYRVTSTRLVGRQVVLSTEPLAENGEALRIRGEALPDLLRLRITGVGAGWKRDVRLEGYERLLKKIADVTQGAQR